VVRDRSGGGGAVDLHGVLAGAGDRTGAVWTLKGSADLNANLVRFGSGRGVEEHANDEVDVLFLGVSGSGAVVVDDEERALSAGTLVFVPRGARRSTRSGSEDFAYLTVHRRRGPLRIGG
jgi:mannose-6-phosphate isomerase-like protein (cupin superfamily)